MRETLVERCELPNGLVGEIHYDETPINPREDFDHEEVMVCFHRRYKLGDTHDYRYENYEGFEEFRNALEKEHDIALILPLYLYDHSGITISTTPFYDTWDSGQVGYVYMTKARARVCYGVKRITKKVLDKIRSSILASVETYDQYLTGRVYGYKILDKDGEEVHSCWGYYGLDDIREEVKGWGDRPAPVKAQEENPNQLQLAISA